MSLLPIPDGPVAAVVAHPDDETFGLGALLSNLAGEGRDVRVLCFTHGEASTVGAVDGLGEIRRQELFDAARVLGVIDVALLDLPDGSLEGLPDGALDARIDGWLTPDVAALVVLEPQGVTGHPDHRAASRAAERVADRRALPVIEWGVDPQTAERLAAEHGLSFESIADGPDVHNVEVDRTAQLAAIRSHASQLDDDPVVCKVLALQGASERVRVRAPRRRAR
ncbi:MAG TPA: PIG-L deacetylase family protein [Acidimicrobiia bacterium]|jgi:LmbE family N-acetylglucosaminyl deacetylase